MGGRKPIYEKALLLEILKLKEDKVSSVLKTCKDRGLPYVSINAAMRRLGLKGKKKDPALEVVSPVAPAGTTVGSPDETKTPETV